MGLRLNAVERAICKKFHVHKVQFVRDSPPYMGYAGTRNDLAILLAELGYKKGAEIGVQRGLFSKLICQANPDVQLKCVDPYQPFTHHRIEWQERQMRRAHQKLGDYKGVEFMREYSIDAAKKIDDGSLDFVYIDAMHYFDDAMVDIITWAPKVRSGGIVSGHDYEHFPECGVPRAVDAYVAAHGIHPYFITAKDPPRSWFFVKP